MGILQNTKEGSAQIEVELLNPLSIITKSHMFIV